MFKKFILIAFIQIIALIIIGFRYIPISKSPISILPVFSLVVSLFITLFGFIFGFTLTTLNFTKRFRNNFNQIYIWWLYIILLFAISRFNLYIRESLEVFNTDRGDILPILPLLQQNIGFYLNSLIFTIPVTIFVLFLIENTKVKKTKSSSN